MCPEHLFGGQLLSLQESEAALGTVMASGPLHQFLRTCFPGLGEEACFAVIILALRCNYIL